MDDEKGKIILLLMASESYHNSKAKKHVRQVSNRLKISSHKKATRDRKKTGTSRPKYFL